MGIAPVEYANIVHSQESSFEDIITLGVLTVDPPRKVKQQLMEYRLQKSNISFPPVTVLIDLIYPVGGQVVYGRIGIAEGPFIGGNLPFPVDVPVVGQQEQLV